MNELCVRISEYLYSLVCLSLLAGGLGFLLRDWIAKKQAKLHEALEKSERRCKREVPLVVVVMDGNDEVMQHTLVRTSNDEILGAAVSSAVAEYGFCRVRPKRFTAHEYKKMLSMRQDERFTTGGIG